MTVIGLIRHGVTAWNKEGRTQGSVDIPLDEDGIQMAIKIGNRLSDTPWITIFTSPLQRAQQTAKIIARQNGMKTIIIDERLQEIGEGKKAGTTEEERIEKWGIGWQNTPLDIEPEQQVIDRIEAFVDEIKENYPNEKVLIVSHGSLIQKMVAQLCSDRLEWDELENASLTMINIQEPAKCLLYNCVQHLTDE